jgi:2-polyprenyl-6-methoxyphenol hydroxylase-like FAD-dependent oxidoreductase
VTRTKLLDLGGFEVRRGMEAIAVLREGGNIVGVRARDMATQRESDLRARWVVGDDGVHSMVRQACGIELSTRLFPVEFLCFGFDWPQALPQGWPHAFLNPGSNESFVLAVGGLPLPHGKGAGLVLVNGARMAAAADVQAEWRELLKADPRIAELTSGRVFPHDFVHVKRPWGHAGRYGGSGAVLLGDAIHPVSPAGGQGANMSVQDARVLADVLLSGSAQPVTEYDRQRRPANERSLAITRRASDVFEGVGLGRILGLFPNVLQWLVNVPLIQRRGLRFTSRAFQS